VPTHATQRRPPGGSGPSPSLELSSRLREDFLCGNGLDGPSVEFVATALRLIQPRPLNIGIRGTVEFLQKCTQEMLLISRVESPNFLLDFRYCTGHVLTQVAEDRDRYSERLAALLYAEPQSVRRNWQYVP